MQLHYSAADIAAIVQPAQTRGTTSTQISGISALRTAAAGDLSFLGNPKYKADVAASHASLVLVPIGYDEAPRPDQQFLLVPNPSAALAAVCARIEAALWPRPEAGVHATAVVHASARVAASAVVGPFCVIEAGAVIGERAWLQAHVFVGREAEIGDDCWLMPRVCVMTQCELQARVRLHPGVVIGGDGFGYEFVDGKHAKVPQVGRVVIEPDVEVGSNSTIDRARFERTLIGEGTKIDNLVQIGHNCVIGRHCLLCAGVGVGGSSILADYVVLGGQAGVAGHLTIGKGAKIGGQAGVSSEVEPGAFMNGTPAIPYLLERRIAVLQRRLPDLFRHVDELQRELDRLKKSSAL